MYIQSGAYVCQLFILALIFGEYDKNSTNNILVA